MDCPSRCDDFQTQVATNRSAFYRAVPEGPFCGFNRDGVEPDEAVIANWVAPGHDGRSQGALRRGGGVLPDRLHRGPRVLKTYKGFPHGMPATHVDVINADLLEFIES